MWPKHAGGEAPDVRIVTVHGACGVHRVGAEDVEGGVRGVLGLEAVLAGESGVLLSIREPASGSRRQMSAPA